MTSQPFGTTRTESSTPLRVLGEDDARGFRLLRDVGSTYRDGAEETLLRLVNDADDVSSDSDELIRQAQNWAQRYHLDPARANVIRALDLPADARVLEIGAGCGAITRYVGERCATVDALEPVPARAAVAAARTADLPGVQVFVGELDDVPGDAAYDIVLVIGVLEYVAGGSDERQVYRDFLDGVAARLVPGGSLVLAIENQLGVKYIAGAPEDHTARVWDSIEGYPRGGRARTFSRRQLEMLIRDSGLEPLTRVAFPDYKITRAVLGDVPTPYRSLLHRIPYFPSPDWVKARPRIGSEAALWQQAVDAGLDRDFGNSFVVVATKGAEPEGRLWPEGRLAVYFSTNRRRELEVRTDVQLDEGTVQFHRTRRAVERDDDTHDGLTVIPSVSAYADGTDLIDLVARDGVAGFERFAADWLALLDDFLVRDPGAAVDALPHNVVVGADGALQPIDVEFTGITMTREQLVRRAVFIFAGRVIELAPPERFAPATTNREVMVALGMHVGLDADGQWISTAIEDELAFLRQVRAVPVDEDGARTWRERVRGQLEAVTDKPLIRTALGEHVWDEYFRLQQHDKRQRALVAQLTEDNRALTQRLARSDAARARSEKARAKAEQARSKAAAERDRLKRLPEVRAGRRARRVVDGALPPGTARRRTLRAALKKGRHPR